MSKEQELQKKIVELEAANKILAAAKAEAEAKAAKAEADKDAKKKESILSGLFLRLAKETGRTPTVEEAVEAAKADKDINYSEKSNTVDFAYIRKGFLAGVAFASK